MFKKVSVILPVYNGEKYIEDALVSVLEQSYKEVDLIVIDDGSVDNTKKICDKYSKNLNYFYIKNSGPAEARNIGLQKAQGEYLSFIDHDDLWAKNKLDVEVAFLEANKEFDACRGMVQCMKLNSINNEFEKAMDASFGFNLGAITIRRLAANKIGLFNKNLVPSEDVDWFMRGNNMGISIEHLKNHISLYYRRHALNITKLADNRSILLQALKQNIKK